MASNDWVYYIDHSQHSNEKVRKRKWSDIVAGTMKMMKSQTYIYWLISTANGLLVHRPPYGNSDHDQSVSSPLLASIYTTSVEVAWQKVKEAIDPAMNLF